MKFESKATITRKTNANTVAFNNGQTVETYRLFTNKFITAELARFGFDPATKGEVEETRILSVTADFSKNGEKQRKIVILPLMPTLAQSFLDTCPLLDGARPIFTNPKRIILSVSEQLSIGYDVASDRSAKFVLIVHTDDGDAELIGNETQLKEVYFAIRNSVFNDPIPPRATA